MHELIEKKGEILFYTTAAGSVKMEVLLEAETVWMTQKMIAELFEVKPQNITMHLKNIYKDEELIKESTCKDFLQVQKEGSRNVRRKVEYYNLDAIIAVGYRVNSLRATHFRIWATKMLREFISKGFVIDDARMKNGQNFGQEQSERIYIRLKRNLAEGRISWPSINASRARKSEWRRAV